MTQGVFLFANSCGTARISMINFSLVDQFSCLNQNNPLFPVNPSHFLWEMPTLPRLKRHPAMTIYQVYSYLCIIKGNVCIMFSMHYMRYDILSMHYDVSFTSAFNYNNNCNPSQIMLLFDKHYRQI